MRSCLFMIENNKNKAKLSNPEVKMYTSDQITKLLNVKNTNIFKCNYA